MGIDMGLQTLIILRDGDEGTEIAHPKPLPTAPAELRRVNQALACSRQVHGRHKPGNRRDALDRSVVDRLDGQLPAGLRGPGALGSSLMGPAAAPIAGVRVSTVLLCTDPQRAPHTIVAWFLRRWQVGPPFRL